MRTDPTHELNYSFNIQRQITNTSSIEVGLIATLASDITSNFLARQPGAVSGPCPPL